MSTVPQQVKTLLQGIREDGTRYDALRHQLEQQRLCMIRRASEELLAVNETIQQHYEQLQNSSQQRRSILQLLGVASIVQGWNRYLAGCRVYKKCRRGLVAEP